MVTLILDRQTVCLWKLKGSVGKFLGNTQTVWCTPIVGQNS